MASLAERIPAAIEKAEGVLVLCATGAKSHCARHRWLYQAVVLAKALWWSLDGQEIATTKGEGYHRGPWPALRAFVEQVEAL